MAYYFRQGGTWKQGTPRKRTDGQFEEIGSFVSDGQSDASGGFSWDQTFTDTSWLYEADQNGDLNVETVTTLDYNGSGGLADAVDNAGGDPTVVVFEVGGVIEVPGHNWRVREDNIWFAGETAPWPGIAITQCRTRARGSNQIYSHLSFLQGDRGLDEYDSTFDIDHRTSDVMLDHCTTAWATEENIGITRDSSPTSPDQPAAQRPSIINTIIAEGLHDNDYHDDYRARGMFSATEYTSQHVQLGNLYAHHIRRVPMMRCESVMCNNYVYNYGRDPNGTSSGGNIINLAGSSYEDQDHTWKGLYYEPGPDTPDYYDRPLISYGGRVYLDDIIFDDDQRPLSDGDQTFLDEPPLVPPGLDLENDVVPASETKEFVKANVGPRPAERPQYEEGLINERLDGNGGIIDSPDDVGGYPDYDPTSHDLTVPDSNIVDWVKTNYTAEVEGWS